MGRGIARHPLLTVVCWAVVTALAGGLALTGFGGQALFDRLHSGEPTVPGSQTQQARQILDRVEQEGATISAVVRGIDLDDPDSRAEAARATGNLRERLAQNEAVATVTDPFGLEDGIRSPQAAPLLARDGSGYFISVTLAGEVSESVAEDAEQTVATALRGLEEDLPEQARVIVSSPALLTDAVIEQMQSDLTRGEAISLPISLLVMVVVFGGFLAAGMPLAGAIASIAGGLGVLLGFSHLMELDSVVVNVVTILGLGLSIDYGLLIVSRFREEIRA